MFDALVNGRIDCGELTFEVAYYDIEELNRRAEAGDGRDAEEDGEGDAGRQHGDACAVALFRAGADILDGRRFRLPLLPVSGCL